MERARFRHIQSGQGPVLHRPLCLLKCYSATDLKCFRDCTFRAVLGS